MPEVTRFYWTAHPSDLLRTRLLPGVSVLIVASAFWDNTKHRFKIRRPPADHIGSLAIDSGGFTAARRWGAYPWSPQQYIDWIGAESRDVPLDWCAVMDYACEREVNRGIYPTNRARIKATIRNDAALRRLAPAFPWLSVLQGNTLEERALDLRLRARLGLLFPLMGIGSICKRPPREAAAVIRWYAGQDLGQRYHAFGLHVQTLDQGADISRAVASWDSYAWAWMSGAKQSKHPDRLKQPGEGQSAFTLRQAGTYQTATLARRLVEHPQPALL